MPMASGTVARYCNITNSCIIKISDNYEKIFLKLSIEIEKSRNQKENISILDFDNKIYFKYFQKDTSNDSSFIKN